MNKTKFIRAASALLVFTILMGGIGYAAEKPTGAELVERLKNYNPNQQHPRLLLNRDLIDEVRELINTDAQFRTWYNSMKSGAVTRLKEGPKGSYVAEWDMLASADDMILKTINGGLVILIEGDTSETRELVGLIYDCLVYFAAYPEWKDIVHALDYGEMIAAYGIAYDWLYDFWTENQRRSEEHTSEL